MFLTQLIRIPSIGIPMYLIKFTVIYEESTKAQVPGEHSIKELPPFRVLALLARQEIFLPHKSSTLQPSLCLAWSPPHPWAGGPSYFTFFTSLYSAFKILSCLPRSGWVYSLKTEGKQQLQLCPSMLSGVHGSHGPQENWLLCPLGKVWF